MECHCFRSELLVRLVVLSHGEVSAQFLVLRKFGGNVGVLLRVGGGRNLHWASAGQTSGVRNSRGWSPSGSALAGSRGYSLPARKTTGTLDDSSLSAGLSLIPADRRGALGSNFSMRSGI